MIIDEAETFAQYQSGRGICVFAVDPGEVTGWAWASVARSEVDAHGVPEALHAAERRGLFKYGQIGVDWNTLWANGFMREFDAMYLTLIEIERADASAVRASRGRLTGVSEVVIEDFLLRERTMDRSLLSPVRLTSTLQTLLYGSDLMVSTPVRQPSQAKGVATDERLKHWGFWHKGQQHARDATRHLILRLRELENG